MIKRSFIFIIILILLFGLIFFIKPNSNHSLKTQTKTFILVVKNNKLVLGPTIVSVEQGDRVVIVMKVDVNGIFQLHGYNKEWHFVKNKPMLFEFTASLSGRFPYELEDTDTEVGVLEVYPK